MFRFRTLTQRFGAIFAVLVAIMVGLTVVVTIQLNGITLDSQRLIEEAREQSVTAQLIAEIDSLRSMLEQTTELDRQEVSRARKILVQTKAELEKLEDHEDDPSREEHQEKELKISDSLSQDLAFVEAALSQSADPRENPKTVAALVRAQHYAQVLLSEAREEATEAHDDLAGRASATRMTLVLSWLATILMLGVALGLLFRGVVRPLEMLRSSTERFGHGERGHRIQLDNLDELGDLAAAFNAMADRLGETQDVLEERVRERTREFIRAARLADLGILASGIAHEINTPLASITSSAEGLQRKTRTGDVPASVVNEYVTVIRDEAYRAREISTRMLSLVHQQSSELTWVELRLVVEQVESALRFRAESRGVQLAVHCSHPLETVNVNPGELVQVLVNLLANAIDASSRGDLVTLSVSLKDGNLHAEIQDQGSGILNEDRERIFEPFFTTKRPGSGTGLGLALVATLTKSHNGRVIVESESGQGSTFRVVFPMDWGQAS